MNPFRPFVIRTDDGREFDNHQSASSRDVFAPTFKTISCAGAALATGTTWIDSLRKSLKLRRRKARSGRQVQDMTSERLLQLSASNSRLFRSQFMWLTEQSFRVSSLEFHQVADVVMERNREGVRTIEVFDTCRLVATEMIDLLLVARLSFAAWTTVN